MHKDSQCESSFCLFGNAYKVVLRKCFYAEIYQFSLVFKFLTLLTFQLFSEKSASYTNNLAVIDFARQLMFD